MSLKHRILPLLLLSFLLPTLITSNPHAQRGSGHSRRGAEKQAVDKVEVVKRLTSRPSIDKIAVRDRGDSNNDDDKPKSTSGTDGSNGKRGLAYNSSSPSLQVFANSDITWVHSWSSYSFDAPSEFLFVPTLWGDEPMHTDNWENLAAGHPYLMSFNEPDIVAQANMEVGEAVAAYKKHMFRLRKDGVQIGAPSVCSGSGKNEAGIPMGTSWLREFLKQCDDRESCVA